MQQKCTLNEAGNGDGFYRFEAGSRENASSGFYKEQNGNKREICAPIKLPVCIKQLWDEIERAECLYSRDTVRHG